jgi:hypothetical protein
MAARKFLCSLLYTRRQRRPPIAIRENQSAVIVAMVDCCEEMTKKLTKMDGIVEKADKKSGSRTIDPKMFKLK